MNSNIFKVFERDLQLSLEQIEGHGNLAATLDFSNVTVEPPRDPSHGDIATNVAMALSKQAGLKPRELADMVAGQLRTLAQVDSVDVAGPGFINVRLKPEAWLQELRNVLKSGIGYGASTVGDGAPVNVEYVSANPTGPMHVGHTRGAVFGDALANLLAKAGYSVNKEYYINDAGAQVDVLARSAYLRYREALGENIGDIPEGLYPGDYLKPVGRQLVEIYGDGLLARAEEEWLGKVRDVAVESMMRLIRDDLAALGVEHETFYSERELLASGKVDKLLKELEDRGLVYVGILEPPKGMKPEDWEPRPQTLFRATDFGDDVDRPLRKSDGSWTYFAPDIAYHLDKFERGYAHMIDVVGADHAGYVKRLKAGVTAITEGKADLDVKICQLVRLFRGGEPLKMSKRSGTFVTLREVVDEVGRGAVRFMMLFRRNDAPLDFDFEKVREQSKDNPVFYVQYAHARVHSVMRNVAAELSEEDLSDKRLAGADLSPLQDPDEFALIKQLAAWPRVVEGAAAAHEPHRVAFYLHEVASALHALWNRGNDEPEMRFHKRGDRDVTLARLAMIRAVAIVVASGLEVLGVEPVEEMR